MKNLFTLIGVIIFITSLSAQSNKAYENAMKSALFMHDTASSYSSEQAVANLYEKIAREYQNEWLPNYWASYVYTQLNNMYGRVPDTPKNVTKNDLMNKAQEHLDQARSRMPDGDKLVESDIHALQALIHYFNFRMSQSASGGEDMILEKKQQYQSELKLSLQKNLENPLVLVMLGTTLLGNKESDFKDTLAARIMLNKANELFKQSDTHRALSTRWNQEWLWLFWLKHADKKLQENL